jgi:hypothetical protein
VRRVQGQPENFSDSFGHLVESESEASGCLYRETRGARS